MNWINNSEIQLQDNYLKAYFHAYCLDWKIKKLDGKQDIDSSYNAIIITTKSHYNKQFSLDTINRLKTIKNRSYYHATDILLSISNINEQHYLLQTLRSVKDCLQNNNDINISKVWINNISIQEYIQPSRLISSNYSKTILKYFSIIEISLGF